MKILAIDTSCDETAAAVTEGVNILSNVIWSQAAAHAKFGGVMPSLAQRMHEERIDWVINKALVSAKIDMVNIDAIAVTIGPGLSIALGVGIARAKSLAIKYSKKLIGVNHLEGHLLSSFDDTNSENIEFPSLGLVISGGNTIFARINKIHSYEVLAQTSDDALGEALDKAARMLGLGYPGGAILEKFARGGSKDTYPLPTPLIGQEKRKMFTYSGLKTAFSRLVESKKPLTKEKINDLAAAFQDKAFIHLIRVMSYIISNSETKYESLLVGGGVSVNVEIRKRLKTLGKTYDIKVHLPKSKKLYGDNAAMIGIAAYYKAEANDYMSPESIDRRPNAKFSD